MPYTFTDTTATGASATFTFSFDYFDFRTSDIHCYVDEVEDTLYTLTGPNQVTLSFTPDIGAAVRIRRIMPSSTYTDFTRGNRFGEDNLNNSALQQLWMLQETLDGFVETGSYQKQDLNLGSYKIEDLGDPDNDQDGATKAYVDLALSIIEAAAGFTIDRFTDGADFTAGSSTTLTLSLEPFSDRSAIVVFDGSVQDTETWSIAGTTITFTTAIPLGTSVVEVYLFIPVAINVPGDGTVTEDKIVDDAVTNDKIVDDAVTNDKIADDAVSEDKIVDDAVTNDKIAEGAVTTNKTNFTYSTIIDYAVGKRSVGSDFNMYKCLIPNGPNNLPLVDPVGDSTKTWIDDSVKVGYLDGFTLSNDSVDSDHDISISTGSASDSEDAVNIDLTSSIIKQIDATWAAETNQGGLFLGSVAADTWYHLFAIKKDSDGSIDVGFDTDINAANIPAGYTAYRRIGSVLTDSSANIYPFLQFGGWFMWLEPELDVNSAGSTTSVTSVIRTPPGVPCRVNFTTNISAGVAIYIRQPDAIDIAPINGVAPLPIFSSANEAVSYLVFTNILSQISWRQSIVSSFQFSVISYFDFRGTE